MSMYLLYELISTGLTRNHFRSIKSTLNDQKTTHKANPVNSFINKRDTHCCIISKWLILKYGW